MPTLTIGDRSVTVGDEFLKLSPEEQNAAVADIAKSLPAAAPDKVTTNQVVRSAATGVPVVGGLLNQANAATNAALAPVLNPLFDEKDQLKGKTFSERRAESLRQQNEMDKRFEEQHPVIDTVAKVAGGVGGAIPLMTAAPAAFGLTGTLPQMVARGAASNAALGGVDAVTRSQDPLNAAAVGGVLGGTLPLAGRAVGKLAQGIREYRNPTPPVAQNVESVAGVDIPLTAGQRASDPVLQAEEEIMRRGGRGGSAEAIAKQADDEARAAVEQAGGNVAKSLDPRNVPAAADSNPVPAQFRVGTKDDTGPWFLGSDKPLYANATRESLDKLYGPQVAAQFDQFPSVSGANSRGDPITVWHKPGQEALAQREIENFKAKTDAPDAAKPRLHYESGLNLGYPEPAARAFVEKRFGPGVLGQPSERTTPQSAAEVVQSELSAQAAARQAAEQQQALQVAAQGETLARDLGGGAAPVSPFDAAENAGAAVSRARDAKVAATREAYKARDAVPGEFDPSVPQGMAESIRARLNAGENPIWVDPTNESTANKALKLIDQTLGQDSGLLANSAAPKAGAKAATPAAPVEDETVAALRKKFGDDVANAYAKQTGAPVAESAPAVVEAATPVAARPVDLRTMDEARKRLVTMFGDAKSKAISTGDKSDMRAMGKILDEFDNTIADALKSGKFSGDATLAADLQAAARKSHSEYRQTFSSRGPGDEIGRAVEKILGRYHDTAATPGEIANMAYGPASNPGSGSTEKIALRLRDILGENSTEWKQYKQGLFGHIADAAPGEAPRAPAKAAGRIDKFLNGQTSRFANKIFSPEERRQMANYAKSLRSAEPSKEPLNEVEKAVARIAGTDGHLPASPVEVADILYGRAGKGDKGLSVRMALRLKNDLTPESWTAVRQGMWEKLTNAGEGKVPFGEQALSQRLHEFLNESGKPLARVLFSKAEREEMAKLASVYKRMTPIKGTTNPSGTAPMLAKIANKASNNVLALIGLGAHGVSGAVAGHIIQKAAYAAKDAKAGKEAVRLFFGPQARGAARSSRLPQLIGASAIPASQR